MAAGIGKTIAALALVLGAIGVLVGTLTTLGCWLSGRALFLPCAALATGIVLLLLSSLLQRQSRVALEALLSCVSLPLVMFGLGLLLRLAQGRAGGSFALAAAMLVSGAVGVYVARRLTLQRLYARGSSPRS